MIYRAFICTVLAVCTLTALPLAGAGGQSPADQIELTANAPIERHIGRGEMHRYRLLTAAGECASVIVEQNGIDVGVSVGDGGDPPFLGFQDEVRRDGQERVEVVAGKAATFTLTITAADSAIGQGAYTIRLTGRRPAADADRVMQESRSLRTTAQRLERRGRFDDAEPLQAQALGLAESLHGPDDLYIAHLVLDLAGNALERRDDAKARQLYERALAAFDRLLGAANPYSAMARSRLGLVCKRQGMPSQAEALEHAALAALETSLGPEHPWYLQSLMTLATLRQVAGDVTRAEDIERGILATLDRTHQTGTMLEASLLNNLADLLRERHDLAAAEPLFRRSLALGETLQGSDTLFVSNALQNLGIVARERRDYPAAEADYRRALAICERLGGTEHPMLAGILNNLANVYRATGDDARALETHFRALRLWETNLGLYSREVLLSVGNIARTYAGIGDVADALVFQRRSEAILEHQIELYLASGSERQKLAFVRSVAERTDRTLSLHLRQAPDNPDAASLAALVLLQRKGRVQDAMTDVFAAVRQRVADPGDRALLDQLKDTTGQLVRLALGGTRGTPPLPRFLAQVEARKERLEATLSEHSVEFRAQVRPVTLEAAQAAIPGDAVALEYAVFRPFDPEAERNEDAYGPPHYAAYVVPKHGVPHGVDLGAVEDIDPLIIRLRGALRNPADAGVTAHARALDERILRPLRASFGGATRLLISPDGGLNLVPFEALVDEHGRFLIERYATTYLTSGRDLLRMRVPRVAPGRPVIVANPLFGEPAVAEPRRAPTPAAARRSITAGADLSDLYFAPLSGTAAEARRIKALFPDATLLTGRRATKAVLEQVKGPRILHIASHGFFLDDGSRGAGSAGVLRNPLLRSGLALAGANLAGADQGAGILTALEAAGLDLWGTRLVTLSACDTGVGEVRNGEGVYGLRRAFLLAGAETLVMSLWPVSDSVARDTMIEYYARLRAGDGRGDALRQAKLAVLKRSGLRHPYYWAAFIQSGDWTGLDSPR